MPSLSVSETTPHGALHQARILRRPLLLVDQHQLGRSAADVEDQRRAVARLEQLVAAEHGKARFLGGFDDVENDSRLVAHPVRELTSVAGAAACLGRDRARERDVAAPQLVRANRQRSDRPVHRLVGQRAGARQPLAQPDDSRKCVDHGEPAFARPSDEQPAIVGAEIDRGISMPLRLPLRSGALIRRPTLLAIPVLQSRRTGDTLRHDARSFLHRPKMGG